MKTLKILFACFFIFNISCDKNHKPSTNHSHPITIKSDLLETDEALDLNSQGIELSKKGEYAEARKLFLKAIAIEPSNPIILNNLGLNRQSVKEYDQAIDFFKEAYIQSDSTYHIAGVNLSLTYYRKKEFSEGIKTANYIIENAENTSVLAAARIHRAFNYAGNKECDKAKSDLEYFEKSFKSEPNAEHHIEDMKFKIKNCVQQRL